MKTFIFFLSLLTLSLCLPNTCTKDECQYHDDCSGSELCCDDECVIYGTLPATAEVNQSCVCERCGPGLACSAEGICVESYIVAQAELCWCAKDSDCMIGFCYDNICKGPPFAEGDRCHVDDQCEDVLTCQDGICTASVVEENAICYDVDSDCGDGLVCIFEEKRFCMPDVSPIGENCAFSGCANGAHCSQNTYECTPDFGDAEPCNSNSECASGSCESAPVCRPLKGIDEICQNSAECSTGRCVEKVSEGFISGTQLSFCSRRFPNGRGCDSDFDCESGFCRDDICSARLENGVPCDSSSDCESFFCKNFGFPTFDRNCSAFSELGEECNSNSECVSGLRCSNDVCSEYLEDGELCSNDNDCLNDECLQTSTRTCLALLPVGAVSFNDADCIYKRAEAGFCIDKDPLNCFTDDACDGPEVCFLPSFFFDPRECRNPGSLSDGCQRNEECAEGLFCDSNICVEDTANQTCTDDFDCLSRDCFIGVNVSYCLPRRNDTEPCSEDRNCISLDCSFGFCTSETFLPIGAECSFDGECGTDRCDFERRCEPLLQDGEECSSNSRCNSTYCNRDRFPDVCFTKLDSGEDCVADGDCISDQCQFGKCQISFCGESLCEVGFTCRRNEDCETGRCGGVCLAALREEGDECSGSFACGGGLYCSQTEERICTRPSIPDDCSIEPCPVGYRCLDFNKECVDILELPTSGDCEDDNQCQFFCDPITRQCTEAYIELFEQCDDSNSCGPDNKCQSVGRCLSNRFLGKEGSICGLGEPPCQKGLYCSSNSKCEILEKNSIPRGDELSRYGTSSRFFCETNLAVDGTCLLVDEVEAGELCYDTIECKGISECINGLCVPVGSLQKNETCTRSSSCVGDLLCVGFPQICQEVDDDSIPAAGDSCERLFQFDGVFDDLMCKCVDSEYQLADAPLEDSRKILKAVLTNCVDTDIEDLEDIRSFTLDIEFAQGENDEDQWADCHASAMRMFCQEACPFYLPSDIVLQKFLVEDLSLTKEYLIDCEAGTVESDEANCPNIRLAECGSLNYASDQFIKYAEDLGLPSPDAEIEQPDRPAMGDDNVGGEAPASTIFALSVASLLIFL